MKAIVNVKKGSAYEKYNGLTFKVLETIANTWDKKARITLDINNVAVDFSLHEVMIVDFSEEMQKAYDNVNWNQSNCEPYNTLKIYKLNKGLQFQPTFNTWH